VPLFVEEVTHLLLERGGEQGGIHTIPPTLQQSLTARLDRLGSAREVAQISAVIGRDFSYKLLREITGIVDAPLQAALDKLADAALASMPTRNGKFRLAGAGPRLRAAKVMRLKPLDIRSCD
jgi:predicted ATPase